MGVLDKIYDLVSIKTTLVQYCMFVNIALSENMMTRLNIPSPGNVVLTSEIKIFARFLVAKWQMCDNIDVKKLKINDYRRKGYG